MYKNSKHVNGILICCIVGLVILFASLFYSDVDQTLIDEEEMINYGEDWHINVGNNSYSHVQLPSYIQNVSLGDTLILTKKLSFDVEAHSYLYFRASHQKVKVYIEDKLIYSFGWNNKRLFSKSPACVWVVVPLESNYNNAQLRIELVGVYENYANRINNIYVAEKSAIMHNIISERLGSILICFILVIIGMSMVAITVILRKSKITASLQRLGFLAILVGVWSACVTNSLQIIYDNVYFLLNLEFFVFNLLLPFFIWFLLSFKHYNDQKWINLFFWISIAQFMIIEGLQLLGIADYMESIIVTHTIMILCMGYIIVTGIWDILHKKATREVKVLIISVILLMLFIGVDLIRFYRVTNKDEGFYTRIGTLLFIGIWGVEVIRNMSNRFVYRARTKALETLAYEDLMTGLKNRTAFEEWMNAYKNNRSNTNEEDVYIIAFDMNGLKSINDNYGHMKGDQALVSIAKIIKNAFNPMGVTYRIGGDEICVILSKASLINNDEVNQKLQIIEEKIASASNELKIEFSVAVGYAQISSKENKDIFEAYKEADFHMYEKKQSMKLERIN